jgi:hypothetical protein
MVLPLDARVVRKVRLGRGSHTGIDDRHPRDGVGAALRSR